MSTRSATPRAILAIVLGYAVAQALNSGVVFALYFGPERPLTLRVVAAVAMCVLAGVLGGYVIRLIARESAAWSASRTTLAIALVTGANLVINKAAEPVWHRVLVLALMAPLLWWVGSRPRSEAVGQGTGAV